MRIPGRKVPALLLLAAMLIMTPQAGAPPAWWDARGVRNGAAADNYAPANLGQAKHMATQALAEMNSKLAAVGGAGFLVTDLFPAPPPGPGQPGYNPATWQAYTAANYAPLNIGQLKNLSYRFYDRLQAIGYSQGFPWTATTSDDDNYAPANLGQLKNVFSFDLAIANAANDSNNDGMADWWENLCFQTLAVSAVDDPDGDGLTNLQEFQQGSGPKDYYNNALTSISIESGNNQSAAPNAWVANPLVVKVTDGTTNAPKANAPIVFASTTALLAATPNSQGLSSIEIRSNAQGKAAIYLKLPTTGIFQQVTASANHGAPVIFYAGLAQLTPSPASINLSVDRGEVQERIITLVNSTSQSINYVLDPPMESPQDVNNPEYNWIDSSMAGGPAYVWNDISGSGTLLTAISSADDASAPITIPFSFPFYGATYSSAYVCSNGYLTFGASSTSYSYGPLPDVRLPALIAPFYDDLDTNISGDVYYQADASKLTIQFNNVAPHNSDVPYSSSGAYTFQMVLESSGTITFYYKTMNNAVTSATVGIQNAASTRHARQVVYNQSYIYNGLAVRFYTIPFAWIKLMRYFGAVAAGQNASVDMTLDSAGLAAGTYTASLHLKDNAGNTVGTDVPVSWTVSGNAAVDSDGDGLPDAWETQHFGNFNQGANDDPDHDGLSNQLEYRLGSDPLNPDTNGDGIVDGVAYRLGISVTNLDMDGDGLTNAVERQRGTDPFVSSIPVSQNTTTINDHTALVITLSEPAGAVLQ